MNTIIKNRQDHESPIAIEKWGWRYHHIGIPTTNPMPGEKYYPHLKMYVSGFETRERLEWQVKPLNMIAPYRN